MTETERIQAVETAIDVPIVRDLLSRCPLALPAAEDPALGARILHLVNTAEFGRARRVGSLEDVVALLGPETARSLVLGAGVLQALHGLTTPGYSIEIFQTSAIHVAHLARSFAPRELAEPAWLVGLLHDVGKIVLAAHHPGWASMARRAVWEGYTLESLERDELGTTHAEVGAAMLSRWGFPFEIVEAIALHHRPSEAAEAVCPLLAVVHAADALYGAARCAEPASRLDLDLLARANSVQQLAGWNQIVSDHFK